MKRIANCILAIGLLPPLLAIAQTSRPAHTFQIGNDDFQLDGRPFVIRSGEMHAARIPREYWRHRLQMVKALGCNTVCAYLFWNQHEPRPGEFDFSGAADVAEYCRIAQEVGLWVILRPGPYACAEWEFGGFPWWLLKHEDIKLRTRDQRYLEAVKRYILRVGRELAPLQVTRGGPILMAQVENEYGSYGNDKEYIGAVRDYLKEAGFDVPLFTCDGPSQLKNDTRDDLFCVVNFGSEPEKNFKALREIRPTGPLMCGEYYPGWFDSWGKPHHLGDPKKVVADLTYMLDNKASFSIYMVHGGTSFGFSAGANSPPFMPQTTSYDYDAPIDEAGRVTPKFHAIRELFAKHLQAGESLPDPPAPNPIITIPEVVFDERAGLFENLGRGQSIDTPTSMELLDQAAGCLLYRTTLTPGPTAKLTIEKTHDLTQVFIDGVRVGSLNRRFRNASVELPKREQPTTLDLLVEAMGRVNYGRDIHDRKGMLGPVTLESADGAKTLQTWQVFQIPLDGEYLSKLRFKKTSGSEPGPAVYRATFGLREVGDTFLDLRSWTRGAVWVNGHALGRYWNIGPQQTLYLPGCWLKKGANEIVVLDVTGDAAKRVIAALESPVLDQHRNDPLAPGKNRRPDQAIRLESATPTADGIFRDTPSVQTVRFEPRRGRYLCLEALSSQNDDAFTTLAELWVLDFGGVELPRNDWKIVYADSEETEAEDGSATNVFDGHPSTHWHTQWEGAAPKHPHQIVIDMGQEYAVGGIRYQCRQDNTNGRIKQYRVFVNQSPFDGL